MRVNRYLYRCCCPSSDSSLRIVLVMVVRDEVVLGCGGGLNL